MSTTTVSKEVDNWCKREALGQTLTDWAEKDTTADDGYDAVIHALQTCEGNDSFFIDELVVWSPFVGWDALSIEGQIVSLYESYLNCAQFALAHQ